MLENVVKEKLYQELLQPQLSDPKRRMKYSLKASPYVLNSRKETRKR